MRIGILTGGGDVPGLNPCIKALVGRAIEQNHEPVGIRRGWAGLLYTNPDDPATLAENILPLDKTIVRTPVVLFFTRRAPIPAGSARSMRPTFSIRSSSARTSTVTLTLPDTFSNCWKGSSWMY